MIEIFGWWVFDPDNEALVNKISGERVRFIGSLTGKKAPTEGNWLRFNYEHNEISYPILVETGPVIYDTLERVRKDKTLENDKLAWQIDHIRSAQLWCEEQNTDRSYPPYGLWRRVDDCVSDALCFWPQREKIFYGFGREKTGLAPSRILVAGGWVNGGWSDKWERTLAHYDDDFQPTDQRNPVLFPLDTPPPSPWVFHDFEENDQSIAGAKIFSHKDKKRFPGKEVTLKKNDPCFFYFPAEVPFTDLENKTVYLQSRDQTSVIALESGDGRGGGNGPWSRSSVSLCLR